MKVLKFPYVATEILLPPFHEEYTEYKKYISDFLSNLNREKLEQTNNISLYGPLIIKSQNHYYQLVNQHCQETRHLRSTSIREVIIQIEKPSPITQMLRLEKQHTPKFCREEKLL